MDIKKKTLAKNTLIILLGKFCTQFISFFLVPLYTRYLLTEEYGFVDLVTTYISLFVPVISLQIEMAVFRYLLDNRDNIENQNKIISTSLLFVSAIAFVSGSAVAFFATVRNIQYFGLICCCIVVNIFSSVFLQIARGLGNTSKFAIACCISGITNVVLNLVTIVILHLNVAGMLASLCLSNLFATIYLFVSLSLHKKIKTKYFNKTDLSEMLRYSIPLIPNSISWWIINASDRTIISYFLGISFNGIFAVAHKFSNLFNGIFNIVSITWTESVSLYIKNDDSDKFFSETMDLIFKLFCFICLAIVVLMPFVFNFIIGESYHEAYYHIPILMYAMLFNVFSSTFSAFYIALKRTKELMWTTIVSAVVNVVINLSLISTIGLYAASISTLVSYFLLALFRYIRVKKIKKIWINWRFMILFSLLSFVCLYSYYFGNIYVKVVSLLLAFIFAFIIFFPQMKIITRKFKKKFC